MLVRDPTHAREYDPGATPILRYTAMKFHLLVGCGVLLASLAGSSLAADSAAAPATTVPQILQMQHALRAKLETPSGEYSRYSENDIRKMERAQDQIFNILNGVTSLDQLSQVQKVDLSNNLDQVKATLLANEDNRLICHVEPKMGSHLTEKRCETVAQRQQRARDSQEVMKQFRDVVQTQHGG
ncbi:MAG: hypothetical protein JWL98_1930 [Xanthomonadaceae bacterium]|nr:hypothetical protein [Xanthomonadaceae bacterium]